MIQKSKVVLLSAVAAVSSALVTTSAFAVANLPASVGPTITQMGDNGQAIFDAVFPVIAAFVGLGVVITLFKRFTGKL